MSKQPSKRADLEDAGAIRKDSMDTGRLQEQAAKKACRQEGSKSKQPSKPADTEDAGASNHGLASKSGHRKVVGASSHASLMALQIAGAIRQKKDGQRKNAGALIRPACAQGECRTQPAKNKCTGGWCRSYQPLKEGENKEASY